MTLSYHVSHPSNHSSYNGLLDPPSSKPLPHDFCICYSLYWEYSFPMTQSLPLTPFKSLLRYELSEVFHEYLKSEIPSSSPSTLFLVLLILSPCFIFLQNLLIFHIICSFYCLIPSSPLVYKLHELEPQRLVMLDTQEETQ